jgi:ATP-dependent RNA helicase DDX54/DBP10
VFDTSSKKQGYRDSDYYMSHYQKDAVTEKGYALLIPNYDGPALTVAFTHRYSLLKDGATFAQQAQKATFDLTNDEGAAERARRQLNWDKKKKRFIQGDGIGADNVKMVKTESGTKLPATYRSGRFDEWKAKMRVSMPRVGEAEVEGTSRKPGGHGSRKFKHNKIVEAKPLDKLHKEYDRKVRQRNKRDEIPGGGDEPVRRSTGNGKKAKGRYGGKPAARVKSELKTVEQIRKGRNIMEKKRLKNARPSRKKGRR